MKNILRLRRNLPDGWFFFCSLSLLMLLTTLLFLHTLGYRYVLFDDNVLILERARFIGNIRNIFIALKEPVYFLNLSKSLYYRPMLNVSFILDAQLWGTSLTGYRITNIIIHVVNVLLLVKLLSKFKIDKRLSIFFATFFAVHPLFVQAVVWIPGRNDTLLTTFFLSAFIYLINYLKSDSLKDLMFFEFFCLLMVFTKESAMLIGLVFLVYYYLYNEGFKKLFSRKSLVVHLFTAAPVVLYLYIRYKYVEILSFDNTSIIEMLVRYSPRGYLVYLGKIFFPFDLSVFPLYQNANIVFGLMSLLLILALFILSRKKEMNNIILGVLIFLLPLFPTFINNTYPEPMVLLEHRAYISVIGIILILSGMGVLNKIIEKKLIWVVALVFVLILCVLNFQHSKYFKNPITFWEKAYHDSPQHQMTSINLGASYQTAGHADEAMSIYERTIKENPDIKMMRNNLAFIYMQKGETERAKQLLADEIKVNPGAWKAYLNLGLIYHSEKKYDQAEEIWNDALVVNPDSVDTMMNLASLYVDQGRIKEAQALYDEVKKRGVEY